MHNATISHALSKMVEDETYRYNKALVNMEHSKVLPFAHATEDNHSQGLMVRTFMDGSTGLMYHKHGDGRRR